MLTGKLNELLVEMNKIKETNRNLLDMDFDSDRCLRLHIHLLTSLVSKSVNE